MDKSRFSMLLLEPGEIYFEDYSSTINDSESTKVGNAKRGRLKLCSKSLVFEPRDWIHPLIKMQFKDCAEISVINSNTETKNVIKVKMKQYAEMLQENILAPYKFMYEEKIFFVYLDFASADECLSQMQQLLRASTLHAPEHNSMVATILHSRYMRMVFDPVMMDDFTEQIVCELQAEKISPLVRHQGKLALTPTTIYFQPFSNVESSPILKLKLTHLKRIYKRRFLLRQVGLEIYSADESSVPHIYLTFRSQNDRDRIYKILEDSSNVQLERVHAEEMTLQWQNGIVSNYDYLMYLNCLADRSKNDLTQYPVFPWVLSDYTSSTLDFTKAETFRDLSKPIGALNPNRLERLKERYHEMCDPKFLYGSHYSAPGLVLFYLVRKYPEYMLCLQNGRFDHPDRMFNSIKDVYNNCLRNMSDFKELVPEFYDTENNGDFLVNKFEINFGERYDGSKVNDVTLPPWAHTPEEFVMKLREALESEYVSRHLHLWIDLIFGYKQRGEEAVKANNVFHHVCYEGAVDLERIYDMNDRYALEVQIMEFGQVPKQLFTKPHVRKIIPRIAKPLSQTEECVTYNIECIDELKLHKGAVTCVLRSGNRVISVGKDGTLKVYDTALRKQIRSVMLSSTPLSSCVMVDENTVAVGSWDNEIYLYDVEYGRVVESFRAHDDSVSCLLWLEKERLLISGGWDGVVRVWGNIGRTGQSLRGLKAEFDHDGKITSLTYRRRRHEIDIITGTEDGDVFIWDYTSKLLANKLGVHGASLCGARFVLGDRLVTAGGDGDMIVTDLSVLDSVFQKHLSELVTSLCGDDSSVLWLGGGRGSLLQWNMLTVAQSSSHRAHDDAINSIFFDKQSKTLITAGEDKIVKIWKLTPRS